MRNTLKLATSVVVATALALTGCTADTTPAPSDSGAPPAAGPVTLTLATFLDPAGSSGREVVLKKLIDDFESEHTNVTIEVQTSQWSLLTPQFLAGVASNNAPDMSFISNIDILKIKELGYFAEISEAFSADDLTDLQSGSWNGILHNGQPHAIPLFPITFGYMYNTEILAANSIDPASLTTWDAFTQAANKLGASGVGGFCQGFSESTPDHTGVTAHLISSAGTLFESDGTPNWDSQFGVDAVNWAKDLIASGGTPQDAVVWTTEDPYEQFSAGQCAMAMAASSRIPAAQGNLGAEKVGFALFPTRTGAAPTVNLLGGWTAGVWEGSEHKDLAAKFLAHLTSAEADALWVQEAGQVPLRTSTAGSIDLPDWMQTVIEGIAIGYVPPAALKADWRLPFNEIMQDVLVNGTDPKAALTAGIDRYLAG